MLYQSPSLANQLEAEETVYMCRDTTSSGQGGQLLAQETTHCPCWFLSTQERHATITYIHINK